MTTNSGTSGTHLQKHFFFFFFGSGVCRLAGQVSWSNLGLHMHLRQARVSWVALLTLAVLSHTLGP